MDAQVPGIRYVSMLRLVAGVPELGDTQALISPHTDVALNKAELANLSLPPLLVTPASGASLGCLHLANGKPWSSNSAMTKLMPSNDASCVWDCEHGAVGFAQLIYIN